MLCLKEYWGSGASYSNTLFSCKIRHPPENISLEEKRVLMAKYSVQHSETVSKATSESTESQQKMVVTSDNNQMEIVHGDLSALVTFLSFKIIHPSKNISLEEKRSFMAKYTSQHSNISSQKTPAKICKSNF